MAFEEMGQQVGMEGELSWDSTIKKENEFVLLKPGVYDFKVVAFERQRFTPKPENVGVQGKMQACPMALVTIEASSAEGKARIQHKLFLHSSQEWALSAFFIAIGLKKHGEPLAMDWSKVMGATGKVNIINRTYNGNDYNQVKSFIDPTKESTQAKPFTPGAF